MGVCGALGHRASRPDLLLPLALAVPLCLLKLVPQSDNQLVLSGERGWGRVSWGSVVPWGTAPHGPTCCFRWLQGQLCCPTCCFRWLCAAIGQSACAVGGTWLGEGEGAAPTVHSVKPKGAACAVGGTRLGGVSWGSVVPWGTAPHGPTCCLRWLLLSRYVFSNSCRNRTLCSNRMTHQRSWGASESLNPRVSLRGVWRARTLNIMLGPHRGCLGTGGWCQVR